MADASMTCGRCGVATTNPPLASAGAGWWSGKSLCGPGGLECTQHDPADCDGLCPCVCTCEKVRHFVDGSVSTPDPAARWVLYRCTVCGQKVRQTAPDPNADWASK